MIGLSQDFKKYLYQRKPEHTFVLSLCFIKSGLLILINNGSKKVTSYKVNSIVFYKYLFKFSATKKLRLYKMHQKQTIRSYMYFCF